MPKDDSALLLVVSRVLTEGGIDDAKAFTLALAVTTALEQVTMIARLLQMTGRYTTAEAYQMAAEVLSTKPENRG